MLKDKAYYRRSKYASMKIKQLGGNFEEQWNMLVNPIIHVESYHGQSERTGIAWLLKVSVVRLDVKSLNKRGL